MRHRELVVLDVIKLKSVPMADDDVTRITTAMATKTTTLLLAAAGDGVTGLGCGTI